MAIDRTGISSLQSGAPEIKYTGDEGPKSPDQQLMAQADPMIVEMYQQYVFEMEEQGMQPMSFREFMQQAMQGMAYGGSANPTYTQKRKQSLAYGGIAGLDGRKRYGIGSWFQEKIMDPVKKVIPNEIKENPVLTAAVLGGAANQWDLIPGDMSSQNWIGDLLSKIPGTPDSIDTVFGDTAAEKAEKLARLGKIVGSTGMIPGAQHGDVLGEKSQQKITDVLNKLREPSLIQSGINLVRDQFGNVVNRITGQNQDYDEQGRPKVRWMEPLAIGSAMGAIQAAMPKDTLAPEAGIDIANIRSRALTGSDPDLHFLPPAAATTAYAQGGRIGAQEGGLMDLGGMEKDYRNEGGFVPIGGQERADDVPARLSKNEFVFTADAVRSAGGGDIDKGAEVMENVMEHLEQGGQISEDSQGLEGARNMFATAQRLEGVM